MSSIVRLQRVYDKVIFDMDGTLVDSHAVVERAWRKWASKHSHTRRVVYRRSNECVHALTIVWFSRMLTPVSWPRGPLGVTSWPLQEHTRTISRPTARRWWIFIAFPFH